METLFLVVVVSGLAFGAWTVFKSFTKKVTPKVSSGGITTSSETDRHTDGSVAPPNNGNTMI